MFSNFVNKLRGVESSQELVARVKNRIEQSKPVVQSLVVEDPIVDIPDSTGIDLYIVSESSMSIEDFKNMQIVD